MMPHLQALKKELNRLKNPAKAKILQRFFKTGKGQYGEGDVFLGIVVPLQRKLVGKYWHNLSLADLDKLLKSKIHEERLIALLILVEKYKHSSGEDQKQIFKSYLSHTKCINNWDLVDLSAPNIVGSYLYSLSLDKAGARVKNDILTNLAKSKSLWERRIAMLATFEFIKRGEFRDALRIAKLLMADKHDLIHKATGWMLREVGKRCGKNHLTEFLNKNCKKMPRTSLRYAIEHLDKNLKNNYLKLK
jgi:3-methyladenine DNA glycosylase AlkD